MRFKTRAVALLLLVSCASVHIDGPVLTQPIRTSGMDALIIATVVFDAQRGCLFLQGDGGLYPVVWPAGASWQESPPGVVLQDGRVIEVGMNVRGGGGYVGLEYIERAVGSEVADSAAACVDPTNEFAEIVLFDSEGEMTISGG